MINNLLLSVATLRHSIGEEQQGVKQEIYIDSSHEQIYISKVERLTEAYKQQEQTQTQQEVRAGQEVKGFIPSFSGAYFFFGSGLVNEIIFLLYYLENRNKLMEWFNHSTIGKELYLILASINRRKNEKVIAELDKEKRELRQELGI